MSLNEDITARILKQLEGGTVPWVKPWNVPMPYNAKTGRRYSGINVLLLWDTPYERPAWLTFHQAQDLKGRIRRGEHATRIVFTATMIRTKDDEERSIPFLKWYHVFNVAQVTGLPEECYAPPTGTGTLGSVESFLKGIKADMHHGGIAAYYDLGKDVIQLPHPEHFVSQDRYYATSLHEHVHWTGHPSRLARDIKNRFGDLAYSFEELVAELGSAFLSADLGLPTELHHAEYIRSWVSLLTDHKQAIVSAAAKASAAAEYLKAASRKEVAA
jgi:antirestriction protein ArdC